MKLSVWNDFEKSTSIFDGDGALIQYGGLLKTVDHPLFEISYGLY